MILPLPKKKLYYCGRRKPLQKPKKPPRKVHLTFSGRCYCGNSTRHYCSATIDLLQCRYRSIAAVTKSVTIDRPFSGAFGLLWRTENRRHMSYHSGQMTF